MSSSSSSSSFPPGGRASSSWSLRSFPQVRRCASALQTFRSFARTRTSEGNSIFSGRTPTSVTYRWASRRGTAVFIERFTLANSATSQSLYFSRTLLTCRDDVSCKDARNAFRVGLPSTGGLFPHVCRLEEHFRTKWYSFSLTGHPLPQ